MSLGNPDIHLDEVLAVRQFILDRTGVLRGWFHPQPVVDGINVATCYQPDHQGGPAGTPPVEGHSCGFYAYDDPSRRWQTTHGAMIVTAVVGLSGKLILCDRLVKAQKMRILALAVPEKVSGLVAPSYAWDGVLGRLRAHYPHARFYTSEKKMLADYPIYRLSRTGPGAEKTSAATRFVNRLQARTTASTMLGVVLAGLFTLFQPIHTSGPYLILCYGAWLWAYLAPLSWLRARGRELYRWSTLIGSYLFAVAVLTPQSGGGRYLHDLGAAVPGFFTVPAGPRVPKAVFLILFQAFFLLNAVRSERMALNGHWLNLMARFNRDRWRNAAYVEGGGVRPQDLAVEVHEPPHLHEIDGLVVPDTVDGIVSPPDPERPDGTGSEE